MEKIFYLCLIFTTLCINKYELKAQDCNIKIDNKELIREIKLYEASFELSHYEHVITLDFTINQDITTITIYNIVGLIYFKSEPVLEYCNIEGINVTIKSNLTSFLKLNSSYRELKEREFFPKAASYFEKNGEYPSPPLYSSEIWVLTFKNGKLISKTIEPDY